MDGGYRPLALQTMPSDVDSLVEKGQETRSAIIPYGVAFALCISRPDTPSKTPRHALRICGLVILALFLRSEERVSAWL